MADPDIHPVETYTRAFNSARAQLAAEQARQLDLAENADSENQRAAAGEAAQDLGERIASLDDANAAFLVKIFTGAMAPGDEVVRETVALDKSLAAVVVSANRPAVMLRIANQFLGGAIAAYSATVAPASRP